MSDLQIGLAVAGWLLSGLLAQLHDLRYVVKRVKVEDVLVTPIVTLLGPVFLVYCIWRNLDTNKVVKEWK